MSQTINVCFKAHLDTCEDCIELTYLKYDAPEEINGT